MELMEIEKELAGPNRDAALAKYTSTCPPMTSTMAGAPPLYGTCTMSILASFLSSSAAICARLPGPYEA